MCWGNTSFMEGHSIQPHEAEMMVDLEALLAGAGDGLATVDELNGLFYGYQATPLDQAPAPIPAVETKPNFAREASNTTKAYSNTSGVPASEDDSQEKGNDEGCETANTGAASGDRAAWLAAELAKRPARKRGRKAKPIVDLDSITDEKERKRQRRLMKNRLTAAMSRERRKMQFNELEESVARLRKEKEELVAQLQEKDVEIAHLRMQLHGAVAPMRPAAEDLHVPSFAF